VPDVTRVSLHGGVCPCCNKRFKATAPEGLEPGSPFGPNLRAFVIYLRTVQDIPLERLSRLLHELIGLEISEGALVNILAASRRAFATQTDRIKTCPREGGGQNAGTAKVDGVEFEALINPSDNDRVELSFNYLDARYSNFTPTLASGASRNFKGLQLDRSPKYTAVAGYTHTFQIGDGGKIDAAVRTHLSAEYHLQDLGALVQYRQPSFTKTDVTLTYTAPKGRWYVQGFAKNLENEITLEAASSGIVGAATIGEPRTFSIRTGIKF